VLCNVKAEKGKKFLEERLPKFLGLLENLLKENQGGDGFLVGDSVSNLYHM
jgi:Glutathione S-transferase, C-terminal domain